MVMKAPARMPRLLCQALVPILIVTVALVGCAPKERPTATSSVAPAATLAATEVPAEAPATPTSAFRVEYSVTGTPTQVGAPTNTPKPTNTPRPPRTPTSAPSGKPNTVYVAGGEFTLGSDSHNEDETPQQTLYIDAFNIDVYPVTNAQYKEFVDDTGQKVPRNWQGGTYAEGKDDHPVTWVTWHDANAYAEWAGKRLPTEAEWERAARGTDGRIYPWGDQFDGARCNYREAGIKATSPVGSYPEGASPDGVMDMAGNVWEWTADWYDAYRGSRYEFARFGEEFKVLRGGSWFDGSDVVRCSARNSADPNFSFSTIGFRCAE
jgi:sulfatase modifying factor 1